MLLTSLDVAHNISLQDVAMARDHWIPKHLHRPTGHEDRKHHTNIYEDVQNDEDHEAPFPLLARCYAHEHYGHGDLASRLGGGRELEGNPCELHSKNDVARVQRGSMPAQAVPGGSSQKTESATQEDLTDFVSHVRSYAHRGEPYRQLTKAKSAVQSSAPTFRTIRVFAQNLKLRTTRETMRPENITPISAGARFPCSRAASMAGGIGGIAEDIATESRKA